MVLPLKHINDEFKEIVTHVFKSGLPVSSRKLVYCKLICETLKLNYIGLEGCLGIDNAFDLVYNEIRESEFEDENVGC